MLIILTFSKINSPHTSSGLSLFGRLATGSAVEDDDSDGNDDDDDDWLSPDKRLFFFFMKSAIKS